MPFNNASDSEIVTKTVAVAQVFTPEQYAYLLSLFPNPAGFAELSNRLEASYPAVLRGDPEGQKAFEAHRQAANSELSLLIGLAKVAAIKDPAVMEKLGLGRVPEKSHGAAPALTGPQNFKVIFNPEGDLVASIAKVPGARGYQVWACDGEPSVDANWRLVASSDQTRGIVITGLNRGKLNLLKIRAVRGKSFGPWSNWIGLDSK